MLGSGRLVVERIARACAGCRLQLRDLSEVLVDWWVGYAAGGRARGVVAVYCTVDCRACIMCAGEGGEMRSALYSRGQWSRGQCPSSSIRYSKAGRSMLLRS